MNTGNVKDTSNFDTGNLLDTTDIINPMDNANIYDTTSICTRSLMRTRSLMDTTNIYRHVMGSDTKNLIETTNVDSKNTFHVNVIDTKKIRDTTIDGTKHANNIPNTSDIHKIHLTVSVESTKDIIHLPSITDFDTKDFMHLRDLDTSDLSESDTMNLVENRDVTKDTRYLFDNEVEKLLCSSGSNDNSLSIQIVTEILNDCISDIFFTQTLIYSITNNMDANFSAETLKNTIDINFDAVNVRNSFDTNVECLKNKDDTKVSITDGSDTTLDTKIMANKDTAQSFISKAVGTSFSLGNEVSRVKFEPEGVIIRNIESIKEPPNIKMYSEPVGVNVNAIVINSLDTKTDTKNPIIKYTNEDSTKNIDILIKNTQDTKILNAGAEISRSTKIPHIPAVLKNAEDTKVPNMGTEIPTNTIDTEICMVIPKSLKNNDVLNMTTDKIIGTSKVVPDESGESNSLEWRNERIALERKINEMEQQVLMQLSRIIRILEKKDQT